MSLTFVKSTYFKFLHVEKQSSPIYSILGINKVVILDFSKQ